MSGPRHLVVGPAEHGVTRLALALARGADVVRVPTAVGPDDLGALGAQVAGGRTHAHVTDRLYGRSPEQAQAVLTSLAGVTALSVTLHDLPQASDGPGSMPRRAACYAAVARASRVVLVSSEHERALLADCLGPGPGPDVVVVPLPIDAEPPAPGARPGRTPDVGLLGFVYPGKGHREVLEALRTLPPDVGVLVLGRASDGHEDLLDELAGRAGELGRRWCVTGYLPDAELVRRLREVAVPVAAHRHVSASGSIGSWLAAGRRPLVPRSRYVDELERRLPGALTVYDDLPAALRRAVADPASTWLAPGTPLGPSTAEVARRYAEVLA